MSASRTYHTAIRRALDDAFLREALDKFAVAYRSSRAAAFAGLPERELVAAVAEARGAALERMDELYEQFRERAEAAGAVVHLARTAEEANRLILDIAREHGCRNIIKAKSMTAEEIGLNHALEAAGHSVRETDLGEWIIQLRHEGPSHMVMPAIHLSRGQVAGTFSEATGRDESDEIASLVKVARRELRPVFFAADMGITGANAAVAENGALALCTNEGNARLVTTLPRVHVALCGLDKLTPTLGDALRVLRVLPRNATGQAITSYVTWLRGAVPSGEGRKILHIIFLDNGRRAAARDPICGEALRCVRCGACANVCPVYRLVGGHRMGHVYIGAIGLILTYFFHAEGKEGRERARLLAQNCIQCGACRDVCAAGIDLPAIIQEIRLRLRAESGASAPAVLLREVMGNRKLFHSLLRFAKWAQKPVSGGTPYLRHLPDIFAPGQGFRALPALAPQSFREQWAGRPASPGFPRVALFAGCVQDFVYPEQLQAALRLLEAKNLAADFPPEQTCCGLPLLMMGEREAAARVALQNLEAFEGSAFPILTLCASCASHLKHGYAALLRGRAAPERIAAFTGRVTDFTSFLHDTLHYSADDFSPSPQNSPVFYHAPCHACRGLGVVTQPRALLAAAGNYVPTPEEDVCCGFGGSYAVKFPEISAGLLDNKLARLADQPGATLVTDCPGCVIQLRGGAETRGLDLRVEHLAEFLARRLR